jgi:DNA polymerase-3 subunit alpha
MVYSLWKHKVLRCCAHAFAYACDSAYGAWLKAHYPYEFYVTMLKLYTEKGDKDKVVAIIDEMKRYKQIKLIPGKWGQDNRDWTVNKEDNTISQSLSSIKRVSQQATEDLYNLSKQEVAWVGTEILKIKEKDSEGNTIYYIENTCVADLSSFTNLLRAIQMNTRVKRDQLEVLIGIGYFSQYGNNNKLMNIFNEFFEGKNKLTKTIKSFNKRLELLRDYEASLPDDSINIREQLTIENDNIGICLSLYPNAPDQVFFVQDVDSTYSIKIKLYSVKRGTVGVVRMRKNVFSANPVVPNQCIFIDHGRNEKRYSYKDGRRIPIEGEYDYWLDQYHVYC